MRPSRLAISAAAVLFAASLGSSSCSCSEEPGRGTSHPSRRDAQAGDNGLGEGSDSGGGGEVDSGEGAGDGGSGTDTGFLDTGFFDATSGHFDATMSNDSGLHDSGAFDSGGGGGPDASPPDSGSLDSGQPDSGPPPGTGDVWVEIDYSGAFSPSSPNWSFSATPGWGSAQWAMAGGSWPEAWDRFNNMQVVSDPIGTVLEIGSGSELQLMIGLEELLGYSGAIVRLEGRSRATSSPVTFDVYNPLNNCGPATSSMMSQDWTIHVVDVDLGTCLLTGSGAGVEAVRVSPSSGTIALTRMRVTLLGATW